MIRTKTGTEPEKALRVRMVYLEVWNSGRSSAFDPVVRIGLTNDKLSYFRRSIGARTETSTLDRQITPLAANVYDGSNLDDLAISFIQKGNRKVDYIGDRGEGKRILVGFSFEESSLFYLASLDAALLAKIELAEKTMQYVHFTFHARNSPKKVLRVNIPGYFASWDKVKLDYRAMEYPTTSPRNQEE